MSQLQLLKTWYETLSEESLQDIDKLYAQDAYFKDPFNELNGIDKVHSIFEHMFQNTEESKFIFKETIEQGDSAFLVWDYELVIKGQRYTIHGSSHIKWSDGKVTYHRDYWDVGEELLLKIPIIKSIYNKFRMKFSVME